VLPSLGLLLHHLRVAPAQLPALLDGPPADAVLVDGRRDLVAARNLCRLLHAAALGAPVLLVVTEGGLAAVTADWGLDDVVLDSAGPAEIEARLRLAAGRAAGSPGGERSSQIRNGDLVIDDASYTAHIGARPMDLTFKEFELLKFLAQHPGRVFTRAHLLQEVWGFDFFGGTRTVDVHVRRLRAKLGVEYEHLIGTVRNVGYRFVADPGAARLGADEDSSADSSGDEDDAEDDVPNPVELAHHATEPDAR
jgi:DNA-binding response OmpR family regulator